jgi:hypothetical protein
LIFRKFLQNRDGKLRFSKTTMTKINLKFHLFAFTTALGSQIKFIVAVTGSPRFRALPSRPMLLTAIIGVAALLGFNTRTTWTGCRKQQSGIGFQSGISVEPIRNAHGSFGRRGLNLGVTALRRYSEAGPARNPPSIEQKTASRERPLSGARILPGNGGDEAQTCRFYAIARAIGDLIPWEPIRQADRTIQYLAAAT